MEIIMIICLFRRMDISIKATVFVLWSRNGTKRGGNGPLPEDARRELGRCGVGNALFHNELHAYKRMFSEDEKMDESYKILLSCLFMQEKQFVVPQTKKQNGKLDEPLLPILRSNRSEQLLRRGQDLNGEDNDVREDAGTGLKEGVEMPNKQKGKGLLIHYGDEPEPERKSTTTVKPNVELPIQVPSPVKRSNVGNLTNDESEKAEIEKCSARQSRKSVLEEPSDKGEDENMEIGKRLSRRSRQVVYNEPSDEDEREEIEKHPSCEVGKNRKGEKVKADIEKCLSRRSRKVHYKEPSNEDMDNDGREDIVKHPSHEVGNVFMKSPQDKNAKAEDTEKRSSRRSSKATYKEPSDQDEDGGEEIEKHPSHKIGNVFMKNPKDKNEKADIEKFSSRRSRKIAYNDLLSNENERETKKLPSREVRNVAMKKPKNKNVEADVDKNSSRRSRKFVLEELSDEIEEIEKRSSREVRNNVVMKKSKKAEAEIEKPSSRRSREVFHKDYSSNDEREEIEKRSSREIKNVVMKKPKKEKAEAEIKKYPSHLPKRAFYIEYSSGKDEDERDEIEKRSSHEVRNNVFMKKSKKAQAEIEKFLSRRSKELFYQDYSSNDDREEIEKRSSHEVRNNVVMKKFKKAEAEIEKLPSRRSREVFNKDYSSNDERDEIEKRPSREVRNNVLRNKSKKAEAEIEKLPSHRSREVFERRSSREVRNVAMKKHKNKKVKDEIEKRSSHQLRKVCSPNESTSETDILLAERKARDDRKVAMKRLRDEDIEEQIERLRNYLLKRSRYGIEGRTSRNFRVGESSAHPKKTDKDILEDEESSDDDSELEIPAKDEYLNGPFVTAKSYRDLDDDCYKSSEESIEFRRKVLGVISKPYDKSELDALYAEFREQCYPAHHPDLVDQLKMNRWRPRKRLAILRGYFFWLQNWTQKGSFRPWNDSVCLDVEPASPLQTRQTPGKRLSK